MPNMLFRSFMVGVCFAAVSAISSAISPVAQAQTSSLDQPMASLLPLEARFSVRTLSAEEQPISLDQAADSFNQQMMTDRAIAANPMGQFLKSLPLVSDFVDETGSLDIGTDFDMGANLPISVDLGNVMGNTGLVFSTDFKLNP
jgi:hypothetical protein